MASEWTATESEWHKFKQFLEHTSRRNWCKQWKKKTHQLLSDQFNSFVNCALEWNKARECMISLCPHLRQKLGLKKDVSAHPSTDKAWQKKKK